MTVLSKTKSENCIDGDFEFIFTLDKPWTEGSIRALEKLGTLKYYSSFPRPMFRLDTADGVIIKGVQDTGECRVIYDPNASGEAKELFTERFCDIIQKY